MPPGPLSTNDDAPSMMVDEAVDKKPPPSVAVDENVFEPLKVLLSASTVLLAKRQVLVENV